MRGKEQRSLKDQETAGGEIPEFRGAFRSEGLSRKGEGGPGEQADRAGELQHVKRKQVSDPDLDPEQHHRRLETKREITENAAKRVRRNAFVREQCQTAAA